MEYRNKYKFKKELFVNHMIVMQTSFKFKNNTYSENKVIFLEDNKVTWEKTLIFQKVILPKWLCCLTPPS